MGRLTAAFVKSARPGFWADGDNLYLDVRGANSKNWQLVYQRQGRERSKGLGSAKFVTLAEAREKAFEARRLLRQGIDPIEAGAANAARTRIAALNTITFEDAARQSIAARSAQWRTAKWGAEWLSTLERYAFPIIGALPVAAIDTGLMHRVLEPVWRDRPDTGKRLRQRISATLEWARVKGYRPEDAPNPARLFGHLKHTLGKPEKVRRVKHHAALAYVEAPAFLAELESVSGVAARALTFVILTATRASEARLARWSEFDLAARVWTVPPERMKGGKLHRVPLSGRALEILDELPRIGEFVFPGVRGGPMHDNAMWLVLRGLRPGLTVHGFRSSFNDWAADTTGYPRHVVEMALAHSIGNAVEAAYRRSDLFEKRRRLMAEWSTFCSSTAQATVDVVPIRQGLA